MPKWFWVLVAVIISSGIYFSIRYGLRPKPIPLMKPTAFSSLEEVGRVSFQRMFQPIRSEKVVVFGYDPDRLDTHLVWQGLLDAARESKINIQKIYYWGDENLPEYFQRFEVIRMGSEDLLEIRKDLIKTRRKNGLVVFIVPSDEATHLKEGSFTKGLEASAIGPVFSLSQHSLVLDPDRLERLSSACTELDRSDYKSRMDCITFRYAKSQARKKIDESLIQGAIERYGLKEYLLFLHTPPLSFPGTDE